MMSWMTRQTSGNYSFILLREEQKLIAQFIEFNHLYQLFFILVLIFSIFWCQSTVSRLCQFFILQNCYFNKLKFLFFILLIYLYLDQKNWRGFFVKVYLFYIITLRLWNCNLFHFKYFKDFIDFEIDMYRYLSLLLGLFLEEFLILYLN